LGESFSVDEFGHRRSIRREALNLARAQEEQELLEQRLSQSNEIERAAMEIIQEDHELVVARDKAAAAFRAKEQDQANALAVAAQQEQDAEIAQLSGNHMMSPSIGEVPNVAAPPNLEMPEPQPRRMRKRFVCRNGTWLRTKRLKRFHVGEKVYVRNSTGQFTSIGVVNKKGGLPAAYLEN
jgi:hypothetical protein